MLLFPNCKINLGLNITRKREDGYHDLETVFYPVQWQDALEGIKSEFTSEASEVIFTSSGLTIAGDPNNNLCVKAYHLLKKDFPELPAVQLHLHKMIPMGAGLGGGSADGAYALRLINDLCRLSLTKEQLIHYALQLGSDCPFFILNKPCWATGRGEKMEEIALDLSAYQFLIVHPQIHVSTADAFSQITPHVPQRSIKEIIQQPVATWRDSLCNDFESGIVSKHTTIGLIKDRLYAEGAIYASMTGSGSAVYGLFQKNSKPGLKFPPDYLVHQTS
jgi:4-diphosphocytidyl-2-C-methyl-D-erythritol kinase